MILQEVLEALLGTGLQLLSLLGIALEAAELNRLRELDTARLVVLQLSPEPVLLGQCVRGAEDCLPDGCFLGLLDDLCAHLELVLASLCLRLQLHCPLLLLTANLLVQHSALLASLLLRVQKHPCSFLFQLASSLTLDKLPFGGALLELLADPDNICLVIQHLPADLLPMLAQALLSRVLVRRCGIRWVVQRY